MNQMWQRGVLGTAKGRATLGGRSWRRLQLGVPCYSPCGHLRLVTSRCSAAAAAVVFLTVNPARRCHAWGKADSLQQVGSPTPWNPLLVPWPMLGRGRQDALRRLAALVRRAQSLSRASSSPCEREAPLSGVTFVACMVRVWGGPNGGASHTRDADDRSILSSSSSLVGIVGPEQFVGVNFATHRAMNGNVAPLRGILKGCAEQNALGALAAAGLPYAVVCDMTIVMGGGRHPDPTALSGTFVEAGSHRGEQCIPGDGSLGVHRPCDACLRMMQRVGQLADGGTGVNEGVRRRQQDVSRLTIPTFNVLVASVEHPDVLAASPVTSLPVPLPAHEDVAVPLPCWQLSLR